MRDYRYSANRSLTQPYTEDFDLDGVLEIDYALAFGVEASQPSPRERAYERALTNLIKRALTNLTNGPDAAATARGVSTHGGTHE